MLVSIGHKTPEVTHSRDISASAPNDRLQSDIIDIINERPIRDETNIHASKSVGTVTPQIDRQGG